MGVTLKSYAFNHYRTKNLDELENRLQTITVASSDAGAARQAWEYLKSLEESPDGVTDAVERSPETA